VFHSDDAIGQDLVDRLHDDDVGRGVVLGHGHFEAVVLLKEEEKCQRFKTTLLPQGVGGTALCLVLCCFE
jgi:hypothetical protein